MKKKLLLVFIMCFVLIGCSWKSDEKEQIKFDEYDYFKVNKEMDDETLNLCLDYFKYLDATEAFCKENKQIEIEENKYYSLEQLIDNGMIRRDGIEYLLNHNIVIHHRFNPILYEIGKILWPFLRAF